MPDLELCRAVGDVAKATPGTAGRRVGQA